MTRALRLTALLLLALLPACAGTGKSGETAYPASQELVDRATVTANRMRADPQLSALNHLLAQARGVMVFPGVLK
ncbi:MAG: hypothetical protein ACNA8S_14310, partial [Deferrisomatales bacterium]